MLKSLKKRSYRFVVVLLLLTTLLTFDVGRVTKVEAIATTAGIAAAALLATGAIYCGYLSLTGAEISIPHGIGRDVQDFLTDVGQKVCYYGSGAAIYNYVYSKLLDRGTTDLGEIDYTFTDQELIDIYNDSKYIPNIQDTMSFNEMVGTGVYVNGFDYSSLSIHETQISNTVLLPNGTYTTIDNINLSTVYNGSSLIVSHPNSDSYVICPTVESDYSYLNYRSRDYYFRPMVSTNGIDYYDATNLHVAYGYSNELGGYLVPTFDLVTGEFTYAISSSYLSISTRDYIEYPILPYAQIYTNIGEYLPMVEVEEDHYALSPTWGTQPPEEDDNKPIVPYVKLPDGGRWGFNIGDFIDGLIDAAGTGIDVGLISMLINAFRDAITGDTEYIYYDNSVTGDTYYTYYSNTNEYNYNINISYDQENIPVDLNEIQQYTNNQYLSLIKEHAETFGETFGELVAFWHNCDPEIVYVFLGASIIVLLGAFIGKWGHS